MYSKSDQVQVGKDPNNPYNTTKQKNNNILIVGVVIILLSWLLPFVIGFFRKRSWQSYDIQINNLINSGMSRQDAIKQVQGVWSSELQSNAITGAGANIALGLMANRR